MEKEIFNVIGVMSGTSLDGVDLCYVKFNFDHKWHFEIIHCRTESYSDEWHDKLRSVINLSPSEMISVNVQYTELLTQIINRFIEDYSITEIDAICSHGHTVFHQPENNLTLQIGNLPELKDHLDYTIVCDFRVQDVQLGGQGAPLVPIGDQLLFSEFDYCLNLGGFANVSFQRNHERIAFDICPVNIVLNHYASQIGLEFDKDGLEAKRGKVVSELYESLNALDFYQQNPPKSLGLEWVKSHVLPLIDSLHISVNDVLRTTVEHIAYQINNHIESDQKTTLLITGGGAYNTFLIERIRNQFNGSIVIPKPEIVEYKEALIFAFLGVLRLRNEVNCLKSVTGAKHDHSSGVIFKA